MKKLTIFTAVAILASAATAAMTGCEAAKDAANAGAEQCGLTCPTNGIAQGNASISGVANIDGFFGAVVNYSTTASAVVDGLAAPLADIKAQLGLEASATPEKVIATIKATYGINGTFKIDYKPPKCQVSAQASLKATAKCDASVDPGSAKVECTGRCDADVKVTGGKAGCDVAADMHCTAPSANVACSGSCKGTCNLTAAAACSGTCNGTCTGTCDVKDAQGNCAGKCDGTCQGKCELAAGASCSGTCQGDCSVQAQGGSCDASAKVECYAEPPSGTATVQCNAKCQGEVTPPSAKAECNASASANASFNADCTPPSIDIVMDAGASATLNAAAYATFEENFKADMAAMVTALQRADLVLKAGASIATSVPGVTASFNAAAQGKVDLKTATGLACAVVELGNVVGIIQTSTTSLATQVQASAAFVAAFK